MSGVDTKHPEITTDRQREWALMRDAFNGESAMKAAGETYLPKPSGFASMPDKGIGAYRSYVTRAQFPEITAPSIGAMVGIAHGQEIRIEMPPALEYLHENANNYGLPLEAFHKRITRHLLTAGRYGVLADAPETGGEPFLTGYAAATIINWDTDFFVLDETHMMRDGFNWVKNPRFRVLKMDGTRYVQTVYEGHDLSAGVDVPLTMIGGGAINFIPFAAANSRDVVPDIETPPLIGVARAALANYQLSADYRWQLYMSGQETLVAINGDAPAYVGAGAVHSMQGTEGVTPDLKYVSPSCSGIDAHREAMADNREAAVMAGARMLEQSENVQESGNARKLRFASETASLLSVVQASCGLLERSLRHVAMMKGLDKDTVTVEPPADLMDQKLTPVEAEALVRIWQSGGVSYQTMYERLQRGGIASPERDHDEEFALIDDEQFTEPRSAQMAAMP